MFQQHKPGNAVFYPAQQFPFIANRHYRASLQIPQYTPQHIRQKTSAASDNHAVVSHIFTPSVFR
jgi:hypothetical protein